MEVSIRELGKQDVEAVYSLERASFTLPWTKADFANLVDKQDSLYLVAEVEGQVAGCLGVTNISGEGDINNVAVAPKYRGRGIAQAMMRELLQRGEQMGITDFTLEVRVSNGAAIHIYEKLGFVSEGIRPGFYDKPKEDAMIMWRRRPQ